MQSHVFKCFRSITTCHLRTQVWPEQHNNLHSSNHIVVIRAVRYRWRSNKGYGYNRCAQQYSSTQVRVTTFIRMNYRFIIYSCVKTWMNVDTTRAMHARRLHPKPKPISQVSPYRSQRLTNTFSPRSCLDAPSVTPAHACQRVFDTKGRFPLLRSVQMKTQPLGSSQLEASFPPNTKSIQYVKSFDPGIDNKLVTFR